MVGHYTDGEGVDREIKLSIETTQKLLDLAINIAAAEHNKDTDSTRAL